MAPTEELFKVIRTRMHAWNLPLAALALLGASLLHADSQFTLSQAQVTPDPTYKLPEFLYKWPHISLEEAKRLHGMPGVLFVDGRTYFEWETSHIPGALSLPGGEFDKRYDMQRARLRKAQILVSYCHGPNCGLADYLAQLLSEKGHRNIAVFWGGFPAWLEAKLPVETKQGGKKP
jgi:rhodanese-related sulfurtransferase